MSTTASSGRDGPPFIPEIRSGQPTVPMPPILADQRGVRAGARLRLPPAPERCRDPSRGLGFPIHTKRCATHGKRRCLPKAGNGPEFCGATSTAPPALRRSRAYPRACGATGAYVAGRADHVGLPPRVRGNPSPTGDSRATRRPTPARAGQPPRGVGHHGGREAYPRACGATKANGNANAGTTGLPPRVRGNLAALRARDHVVHPTPARAGQPPSGSPASGRPRAYPRACGATRRLIGAPPGEPGLPPRVRGNHAEGPLLPHGLGPTPARAGQPTPDRRRRRLFRAYPRACGATLGVEELVADHPGLPPRVRGNPLAGITPPPGGRPTPARAGQPRLHTAIPGVVLAYPRACGATYIDVVAASRVYGLPPRVRGNLAGRQAEVGLQRPTPARAGQPRSYSCVFHRTAAYPRACGATS